MQTTTDSVARQVDQILMGLATLTRLNLLSAICEPRITEKQAVAEHANRLGELCSWAAELQLRYLHRTSQRVGWPTDADFVSRLELAANGDELQIRQLIDLSENRLRFSARSLHRCRSSVSQLTSLIPNLVFSVVTEAGATDYGSWDGLPDAKNVFRAIRGPSTTRFDPVFEPTYSLVDEPSPRFSESLTTTIPYFWTLSLREANVADVCALSAVEYDGLPHAFYRDLAKQCADEARHATMFYDLSLGLLSEMENEWDDLDRFSSGLARFKKIGKGLQVPREGGLYEAMWNATLDERLVLMQIRTEAPAVVGCKQRKQHSLCKRYSEIALCNEVDEIDEISHAAIGFRWLKHIYPDDESRREVIDRADLLRGFLLATSIAARNDRPLVAVCEDAISQS